MRISSSVVGAACAALLSLGCGSATLKNPDGGSAGSSTGGAGGSAGAAGQKGSGGAGGAAGSGGSTAGAGGAATGGGAGTGGGGGANACANGKMDGAETDIDCGGGTCGKCDVTKACASDGDCKTGSCSHLYCALVSVPPNWLPGPSLNYGRGILTVAVYPLTNENMLMFAIGGRDDSDSSDPPLAGSYEYLDTTAAPPLKWNAPIALPSGYGGPAATDAAGAILMFLQSGIWGFTNGGWGQVTTSLPIAATPDAAALGPNGLVYVVSNGALLGYDPVANKWTTGLAAMPTPRTDLGLAAGSDGRLYAIGGYGATTLTGAVEAYTVGTNTWTSLSALPADTNYPGVANAPDGRIYALGGATEGGVLLNTANAYTPKTNRWTPVTPLSVAHMGVGAVVAPDGHLYAVGGTTNFELPGETSVEVYGPVVSASPQAGAPGDSIAVSGSNFAASATVSVYLGSTTSAALATGTTDASGKLTASITFKVPNLAAGSQALIVMDDRSQYPITLVFRVQ